MDELLWNSKARRLVGPKKSTEFAYYIFDLKRSMFILSKKLKFFSKINVQFFDYYLII